MKLKPSDIENLFHQLADIEIYAAMETGKKGEGNDTLMAQSYVMAVNRCKQIISRIMKDVEE